MIILLFVIHVAIAMALVGVILLQKSEGGALGMGGGGMSGFMTGRSTANLLTRTTAILAACFMLTSIALAILAARSHSTGHSILDQIPVQTAPAALPKAETPPAPETAPAPSPSPEQPSVPLAK